MGVDVRWFNHDRREFVRVNRIGNDRWAFTGHPTACAFYALVRGRWNGDRVALISDTEDAFSDLPLEGYADVTEAAKALLRDGYDGCACRDGGEG